MARRSLMANLKVKEKYEWTSESAQIRLYFSLSPKIH